MTDIFGVPLYQPLVDAANALCAFEFIIAYELHVTYALPIREQARKRDTNHVPFEEVCVQK